MPISHAQTCESAPVASVLPPLSRASADTRTGIVRVADADGTIICERCEIAGTFGRRFRGLMGRRQLDGGSGLLLRPAGSVHTCFMRFPIDVVVLDRDLRVLKLAANVAPWRMSGALRGKSVLELVAGEAERRGLTPGAELQLLTAEDDR